MIKFPFWMWVITEWNFCSLGGFVGQFSGGNTMEVTEKVMRTYGMMVNLTQEEELLARERLALFLKDKTCDENQLTIEALKYLRGVQPVRTRRARS